MISCCPRCCSIDIQEIAEGEYQCDDCLVCFLEDGTITMEK